ncbi:MAG: cyanophycin synthetase, partial [Patescibacteria group bacterium]
KEFLAPPADKKIVFVIDEDVEVTAEGSSFTALGLDMELRVPGRFNVENALAAISVVKELGLSPEQIATGVAQLRGVPGRLEKVEAGQPFTVIVDYAFEPGAMQQIYDALALMPHERLIHVLGSCGGGRDAARRPILGRMSGETADITIVTNEDPYDDDPMQIIREVAAGSREAGKKDDEDLFIIEDRGAAIGKAIALAKPHDIVLITGKGSEPVMAVANGKLIPWDDREVARKEVLKLQES